LSGSKKSQFPKEAQKKIAGIPFALAYHSPAHDSHFTSPADFDSRADNVPNLDIAESTSVCHGKAEQVNQDGTLEG
jgi:hypothetical protein